MNELEREQSIYLYYIKYKKKSHIKNQVGKGFIIKKFYLWTNIINFQNFKFTIKYLKTFSPLILNYYL